MSTCGGTPNPGVAIVEKASDYTGVWNPTPIDVSSYWTEVTIPTFVWPEISSLTLGDAPPAVPAIPVNKPESVTRAGEGTINPVDPGARPTIDIDPIGIYIPTGPGDFTGTAPGEAPTIGEVTLPTAPTISLPSLPVVSNVTLPTLPTLNIPTWSALAPTSDIRVPDNEFSFNEEDYSSAVLTSSTNEILRMLEGGYGVPDTVWRQIYEKGADRESLNGVKLVEAAINDRAERGWSTYDGVLEKNLRQAQQAVQNASNTLSREITIKQADMEVENIKYAVSQALALDGMLIQLHNSSQDRALKASEISMTIAIQLTNARIAIFNAELQAYQVEATVFKTLIEAELARVEIYKAEIQGASLAIEVDRARVEAYKAQIQGLTLAIEAYNAQIKGVQALVDVEKTRVMAYGEEVKAYGENVKAWGTQWEGYKAVIGAQGVKADIYKAQVEAFAAEVGAYKAAVDGEAVRVTAETGTLNYAISRMTADVQRYSADVDYEKTRVTAIAEAYKARMAGYSSLAAFKSAQADGYGAEMRAIVAAAEATATTGIEGARIQAATADAIGRAQTEAEIAAGRTEAQLVASRIGQFSASAALRASSVDSFNYSC